MRRLAPRQTLEVVSARFAYEPRDEQHHARRSAECRPHGGRPRPRGQPRRRHRARRTRTGPLDALGAPRHSDRGAGRFLLRAPHEERPLGSVRAQCRRPLAPHRAQHVRRVGPRADGRRQLAPPPERPGTAAAPFLDDRRRVQAVRLARMGGPVPACRLGIPRRSVHVRLRGAPLRPAGRGVRGRRAVDDASLLRASAHDARGHLHDVRPRDGIRRPGGGHVRPRRGPVGLRADRAGNPAPVARARRARAVRGAREQGRPPRTGRAHARRGPVLGGRPRLGEADGIRPGGRRGRRHGAGCGPRRRRDVRPRGGRRRQESRLLDRHPDPRPVEVPDVRLLRRGGGARAGAVERVPAVRLRPAARHAGGRREGHGAREPRARCGARHRDGGVRRPCVPRRPDGPHRVHRARALRRGVRRGDPRLRAGRAGIDRRRAGHARPRRRPAPRLPRAAGEGLPDVRPCRAHVPGGLQEHGARALVGRPRGLRAVRALHLDGARRRARPVRPRQLREGPPGAPGGVRRRARLHLPGDGRGRVARGPRRHRGHEGARPLAAADVVHRPRRRDERLVGRRVRAAGRDLRRPLRG